MENKDTSVIPEGPYCYTFKNGEFQICPYWSKIPEVPEQYSGYCSFLEKGDLDIEKLQEFVDMQTGEYTKGEDLPFPTSLLWDQCKECGINDEYKED